MRKTLYISAVLFCLWFGGFLGFVHTINNLETDPDKSTDAIIALTGGRNRLGEAVNLLNDGKAEKLFISGVFEGTSLEELKNREDVNVHTSREITLGKQAQNTVENAIEALAWARAHNIKSIRLVTSNYHLPRSLEEFRFGNPNLEIIPHPVFSDQLEKDWWKSWRSFAVLAMEYNKFLYVWVSYRIKGAN